MKKTVIIEDKAKSIFFKNRTIRTPVVIKVTDDEMKYLKMAMKTADIQNWKCEVVRECDIEEEIQVSYDQTNSKSAVIEELEAEPSTILETLVRDGESEKI
jgi:hypothetical protein